MIQIELEQINSFDDKAPFYDEQWLKYKTELIENDKYSVYQGVGEYSLVKLLIKEEIKSEIESI